MLYLAVLVVREKGGYKMHENCPVVACEAIGEITRVALSTIMPGGVKIDERKEALYDELVGPKGEIGKLIEHVGNDVVTYDRVHYERLLVEVARLVAKAFGETPEQIIIANRDRLFDGDYERLMRPNVVKVVTGTTRAVLATSSVQMISPGTKAVA